MTSSPDNRRVLGIDWFEFHAYKEGRIEYQPKLLWVFSLEVQGYGFLKICNGFIDGLALGDNTDLNTFCYIVILTLSDKSLDRVLQMRHRNFPLLFIEVNPYLF